jgi:hypothetical protein
LGLPLCFWVPILSRAFWIQLSLIWKNATDSILHPQPMRLHVRRSFPGQGFPQGTIGPRSNTHIPFESYTKDICTSEPNRVSDALNAVSWSQQSFACFGDTGISYKLRGTFAKSLLEKPSEVASRHAGYFSQHVHREIVAQVRGNPSRQVGKTIRRLDLKF